MKNITVVLDTNIIMDCLEEREPFFKISKEVVEICSEKFEEVETYICSQSIADTFYLLRKKMSFSDRRKLIKDFCILFNIVGANKSEIMNALNDQSFEDFEDCIIQECAKTIEADYIITRNVKDFENSKVKAILPEDFLEVIRLN